MKSLLALIILASFTTVAYAQEPVEEEKVTRKEKPEKLKKKKEKKVKGDKDETGQTVESEASGRDADGVRREKKERPARVKGSGGQPMSKPYYLEPMFFSMNIGIHFAQTQKTILPPIYLHPELTIVRNFTLGPQILIYKYKDYVQFTSDNNHIRSNKVVFPEDKTDYTHLYFGLKGAYHFHGLLEGVGLKMPKELDLYATGSVGYNSVSVSSESVLQEATADAEEARLRGGLALGLRVLRNRTFGGFLELGYTDYGYGAVGLTWFVSK